jgi:DNA-binding transcriptional LysR family regulator
MKSATIPDLSAGELQAICTIAENGSFMAASLDLNMSQPALTRTVQRVESTLGLKLFRRTTRRVETTPAGIEFVALANRMLSDLRISYASMREISDEQRGRVIISAVMSVAYTQMPRLVGGYRGTRPGVEIQLREGVHGTVVEDVRSGVADLGISYLDEVPGEFSTITLGREVFHVVMPKRHPLAAKKGITLEDLTTASLVSLPKEAHTRRLLDGLAAVAGLSLQHAVTVHHFATVMQCVRAGVGIALVPAAAVSSGLNSDLVARPLVKPALSRTMGVLVLKERALTPSAKGFLAHLQAEWDAAKTGRRRRP